MHTIVTLERLREREHQLHAYCHLCDRWRVLNLDDMLQQWRGLACAPDEVPCTACGQMGILKVRRQVARDVEREAPTVASRATG
jgi:hypothetical protein